MPGRASWTVLAAIVVATACGGSSGDYRVSLDLGPDIRALGSDDLEVSERASDRVVVFGVDAVPALEAALAHEPVPVRRGVVEALGRIDAPAAARVVATVAARDADVGVRYDAIGVLGARAAPEGRTVVEAALADRADTIRLAAAGACAALCTSPDAMARLVVLATSDEPLPNVVAARTAIVRLLGAPDADVAARVRAAARRRVDAARSASAEGDMPLLVALLAADIEDDAGRARLARAASGGEPPVLRLQAIHALGRVGAVPDVEVLARLDGEPTLGLYAYDALRRLAERGVAGAGDARARWRGAKPAAALPPPPGSR